jgi:DNA-directed RNA polymerase subunit RPC12/RpoP
VTTAAAAVQATGQARVMIMVDLGDGTGPQVRDQVDGTVQMVFICQECDQWSEEAQEERLYQCGTCDRLFVQSEGGGKNGNMCPDCGNKFGTKLADRACASCLAGEVDEEEGVVCECGTVLRLDDWWEHVRDEHLG